jgi:carboxyl-terminal processing protease
MKDCRVAWIRADRSARAVTLPEPPRAPAPLRRKVMGPLQSATICALLALQAGCSPKPAAIDSPPAPRSGGVEADAGVSAEPVAQDIALATFDTAWARIARMHYDSSFNGVDWDAVRVELRPEAASAATTGELRATITEMLDRLGESHYGLIPREVSHALETPDETAAGGEPGDLGMEARLVDGRVVVFRVDADGPAAAAGVRPGWTIERIGVNRLEAALARLAALGETERRIAVTRFTYAVNAYLGGPAGSVAKLALLDGTDRAVVLDVQRRPRPGEPVRFGNLPTFFTVFEHERLAVQGGGCVGVIRFSVWMLPVAAAFDRALDDMRDCAGVVIDVRGNPGGVAGMVMGIAGHFFAEPTPLGFLRQRGTELKLVANPRRVAASGLPVEPFAGRVAVLTDEASVSTSEIFAAGMQAQGRARVFGDTTAGQALPAVAVRLPNGDVLMHVIADLTGPDGRRIEGSGVPPDQLVPLTRADLLAGRDAPLDAAVLWIAGRPAASTTRRTPAPDAGARPSAVTTRWR